MPEIHKSLKIQSQVLKTTSVPGSPIPLNSKFYIERPPIEARACAEIVKPGSLIRIKAPQKMGKSSLLLRIIDHAQQQGYQIVIIDFQQADTRIFASIDQFLRWFCANVARQLKLKPQIDDYWDIEMGTKVSASVYFQAYLLEQINTPIVLVLNEVNYIFEKANIAVDFLPLLRNWHEQAMQNNIWQKLRLIVVHSAEVDISLNVHQSPFNVGLSLQLPEFTPAQVQELAWRYEIYWFDSDAIEKLMRMVGGHPYLIHLALYELHEQQISLEKLLREAPTQAGIYSDHLRYLLAALQNQPELAEAFYKLFASENTIDLSPALAYQLNSMGLVKLQENIWSIFCELYRLYFYSQTLKTKKVDIVYMETLEQENQRLKSLVNIDELTRIANRRYFDNYLQTEWKRMDLIQCPLSLILCDIDRFKLYNETYGHKAGDNCLREIAQAIYQIIKRPSDLVARYGGEELAIILPNTDAKGAVKIAEDIRNCIKDLKIPFKPDNFSISLENFVTVSLGVASTIPGAGRDLGTLLLAADRALFNSKKQGRDRVTLSFLLNYTAVSNSV